MTEEVEQRGGSVGHVEGREELGHGLLHERQALADGRVVEVGDGGDVHDGDGRKGCEHRGDAAQLDDRIHRILPPVAPRRRPRHETIRH